MNLAQSAFLDRRRSTSPNAARLAERDYVLAEIESVLDGSWPHSSGPIVVEGGPGLGKTALINVATHIATKLGQTVARARCTQDQQGDEFRLLREIVRQMPGFEDLFELLQERTNDVNQIIEDIDERLDRLTSGSALIAIDDAQWADLDSAAWLLHSLCRREHGVQVMIAVQARRHTTQLTPMDRLLFEHNARILVLEPLSPHGVRTMLEQRYGAEVDQPLVDLIHRITGGVPLLAVLTMTECMQTDDCGVPQLLPPFPPSPSIVRWVLTRLGSLPLTAYPLLEAAAVLGSNADLRIAAAAASIDVGDAGKLADELADLGILSPGRPLNFVQEAVRSSIYANLPTERRSDIHEFAAQLLSAKGSNELSAEHLLNTEPRNNSWAARTLTEAAREAFAAGDVEMSTRFANRALAETMASGEHPELLLVMARLAAHYNDPVVVEHLETARTEHSDVIAVATTGVEILDQMWRGPLRSPLLDVLIPLGEALKTKNPVLALQIRTMAAVADQPQLLVESDFERNAIELDARTVSDHDLLRLARVVRAIADSSKTTTISFGDVSQRVRDNLTVDVIARSRKQHWSTAAVIRVLTAMVRMGVTADVDLLLKVAHADAVRDSRHLDSVKTGLLLAESLRMQGRLAVADEILVQVALISPEGSPYHHLAVVSRAALMSIRGAPDRALDHLPVLDAYDWRDLGPMQDSHGAEECGRVRLVARQWEAALDHFAHAEALANAHGIENPALTAWRIGRAEALVGIGEAHAAFRLATENLEMAREFGAPVPIARGLRCLAATSPMNDRALLLEEALDLFEGQTNEVDRCKAMIDLGRVRRELHETDVARTVLRNAADVAVRIGAASLTKAAADELRLAGARPRRLQMHGSDSLTPSERRVVIMAAEGKTNSAIASELYVSLKTVESHLARAYRKLGVNSRLELSGLLQLGDEPDNSYEGSRWRSHV